MKYDINSSKIAKLMCLHKIVSSQSLFIVVL